MSDPIAQAAEALNAAPTEPAAAPQEAGTAASGELPPTNSASQSSPAEATTLGNVLVNETPVVAAPEMAEVPNVVAASAAPQSGQQADTAQPIAATASDSSAAELPRESHLMLLGHKLAAMHAKFKTGERIVIDEFEQILGHIKAVL